MDAPCTTANSDKTSDALTSNGIKDAVCLVDIPMPSVDESQSDINICKDGIATPHSNSIEPSTANITAIGIISSEKSQNDIHRQFSLISVPPPPPPSETKTTFSSNIVITTQRTVKHLLFNSTIELELELE